MNGEPDRARTSTHGRLYNFIALTLRAYILSWLPRITRDRSLLPHVHTTIIAPILAPIFEYMATHPESFVPLILHDIPGVLTLHCRTYWQARRSARLCTNPLDEAYHASLPLLAVVPALASTEPPEVGRNPIPEGQYIVSGLWLTSMADAVVKHSLSEDDYKVTMQRTMAREIIGRTVLGTVARRVGEPWFWWGLILKCLPEPPRPSANNRSVTVGIVLVAIVHHTLSLLSGIWTALTWLGASLTEAPETQYVQVTDSWVELLRELLNVDGRQGRQNWVLKMVYGMVEGLMWLLSPLFDRSVMSLHPPLTLGFCRICSASTSSHLPLAYVSSTSSRIYSSLSMAGPPQHRPTLLQTKPPLCGVLSRSACPTSSLVSRLLFCNSNRVLELKHRSEPQHHCAFAHGTSGASRSLVRSWLQCAPRRDVIYHALCRGTSGPCREQTRRPRGARQLGQVNSMTAVSPADLGRCRSLSYLKVVAILVRLYQKSFHSSSLSQSSLFSAFFPAVPAAAGLWAGVDAAGASHESKKSSSSFLPAPCGEMTPSSALASRA